MATAVSAPELRSRTPRPAPTFRAQMMVGLLAAGLVVVAFRLPIWRANLSAPQYPAGLELAVYGDRVQGDIAEINQLNHYVGMKPFDPADIPEMRLWPVAVYVTLAGIAVASLMDQRWPGRLARLGLWLVPVVTLADIQFRLHQYGHSVDPEAPIRLEPFTPLVVGPTKVLNFTTWAYPGEALWLLAAAAFFVTFGVRLLNRRKRAR